MSIATTLASNCPKKSSPSPIARPRFTQPQHTVEMVWSMPDQCSHRIAPVLASVRIFDYFLQHEDGYETFHAKILVADDTRAYVGSATFLRFRKNSLELGVMVKGHTARTIRFLSDAMKEISRSVSYGRLSSQIL